MFLFLKYIRPIWYYRLAGKSKAPILADISLANGYESDLITTDNNYSSITATRMDAAYQGLVNGFIPTASNCIKQDEILEIDCPEDNYRFIRKYFGTHWYFYVFLIRLFTLKNPLRESSCFIRSLKVKRTKFSREYVEENFDLINLKNSPLVSVIIPTLNRYNYLKNILSDLEKQDYDNFEVLICDQSDDFREDFYDNWNINIRIFRQTEKALWLARNTCIMEAKGSFIALTEDDVRINPDWLRKHLFCIEKYNADASCGIFYPDGGSPLPAQTVFKLSEQFATGNSLIKSSVFSKIGLFDRQFEKQRMGDGEFGLRSILAGYKLIQNPLAYCIDVKAPTGGLREFGLWDAFGGKGIFSPSPVPSVLYFSRKYFGVSSSIFLLLINVSRAFLPYRFRNNKLMKSLIFLITPLLFPIIVLRLFKSWQIANKMLTSGAKISMLTPK